ncbi:CdaR family protein [Carnobacterium antarcticum]|uniref:YbbR-like domain-containing protein n=1 Tax=Carnobacterium antarcticum TaxID=2126436 RepID=A0ABW4NPN8_9LACT|nr:CdaR family protein [Carnobacterium sp. CP1]ALV22613.1 putative secreted protein associated with spyDAC [Carnobacterium sp. CP1]
MEKIYNSPWFTKLVAFGFAVLLFTYVNYENTSKLRTTNPLGGVSITSSKTITNVPIVVDIDQDQYFVSGFPETASVEITGPTNIVAQTTANKGFDLVAQNLDQLGVGTHTIRLIPEGLSSDLNYTVTPSEVTIKIEEKRVETFKVGVVFEATDLAKGYVAGQPTLNYDTVEISGAASTIDKVHSVQAIVTATKGAKSDIKQTVPISVSDVDGNQLDVNINPSEVTVSIPVAAESKEVPVSLIQTGEPEDDYTYELGIENEKNTTVSVTGSQELLDDLSSFPVEVDVTGITETTTKEVELALVEGASAVTPEKVNVRVTVVKEDDSTPKEETPSSSIKDTSSSSTSGSASSSEAVSSSEDESSLESSASSEDKIINPDVSSESSESSASQSSSDSSTQ